jgi:hypothetical protein
VFDRPAVGTTPLVHVEAASNTFAFVAFGLQPASIHHGNGCWQGLTIDATLAAALGPDGQADLPFVLPNVPAFRGVQVLVQAAVLDGGPVFGASLTHSLRIQVGD